MIALSTVKAIGILKFNQQQKGERTFNNQGDRTFNSQNDRTLKFNQQEDGDRVYNGYLRLRVLAETRCKLRIFF
jgi:hypothetical protein